MIVNDVMQQAQCEQPSEKVTKVRGRQGSIRLEPGRGRSRALACRPAASEAHVGAAQTGSAQHRTEQPRLEVFQPVCGDAGIAEDTSSGLSGQALKLSFFMS